MLLSEAADAEYAAGLLMIPGTPSKLLTLHDKHFPTVCVCAKIQRLRVLILYTTSDIYTKQQSQQRLLKMVQKEQYVFIWVQLLSRHVHHPPKYEFFDLCSLSPDPSCWCLHHSQQTTLHCLQWGTPVCDRHGLVAPKLHIGVPHLVGLMHSHTHVQEEGEEEGGREILMWVESPPVSRTRHAWHHCHWEWNTAALQSKHFRFHLSCGVYVH